MIPTRSKSKLPKTLSYPLGAQAISEARAEAPHAADFTLSFSDTPVWPASEFQRRLREGTAYLVFVAAFEPVHKTGYLGAKALIERGRYEAHWTLKVNPVRRELRHAVAELLRAQGVPAVVEWLRSAGEAGWEGHRHQLRILFRAVDGVLLIEREDGV